MNHDKFVLNNYTFLFVFRFVIALLSTLENSFNVSNNCFNDESDQYSSNKTKAVKIALKLLNHSTQACIQLHSKSLVTVLQSDCFVLKVLILFIKIIIKIIVTIIQ